MGRGARGLGSRGGKTNVERQRIYQDQLLKNKAIVKQLEQDKQRCLDMKGKYQ